jgi:hypothetical protein
MTKLSIPDWRAPERREGRTAKAFLFLWSMLCWTTAFAAVVVAFTLVWR